MATPLLFSGSLYVVPDGFGLKSLPMAFALTGLASLVVLLLTGRGRALHTTVISLAVIGGAAAVVDVLWNPMPRAVGAVLATVSVIVVYMSPRVTILLAKLPVPRVPTAGEPLDDIETQGGTTVEGVSAVGKQVIPTEKGMTVRVRRASQYLTGILAAAAITATVGCYLAVDVSAQFYWQGAVFAVAVATVLCLRGRSHHDLVQSATLISAGLAIALLSIVKMGVGLDDWEFFTTLALVVLMVLVVACGIIAPRLEFSPVMRRQVEILEYLAIAARVPAVLLDCAVVRVFPRASGLTPQRPRWFDLRSARVGAHSVMRDQRRFLGQLGTCGQQRHDRPRSQLRDVRVVAGLVHTGHAQRGGGGEILDVVPHPGIGHIEQLPHGPAVRFATGRLDVLTGAGLEIHRVDARPVAVAGCQTDRLRPVRNGQTMPDQQPDGGLRGTVGPFPCHAHDAVRLVVDDLWGLARVVVDRQGMHDRHPADQRRRRPLGPLAMRRRWDCCSG